MAVNLSKYKNELLAAWKDVVDDKTANDWALFGYEKQTNDLKVISSGDGGLEELANEFNCGKVMYAFCRVIDPKTELPKFVFINWQGEGAPLSRKGTCANHVADVSNFFKGTHVTINARTEDDIDPATITEKVGKASASKFNFKERSDPVENMAPVGSVYKRIQPTREINFTEREKFWEKEQAEEKQRIVIERRKADEERKRLELERKEREIREGAERDKAVKERAHSISQMKEAEKNANNVNKTQQYEKMKWEKQLQDDAQEERERKSRSESMRRESINEAQNLISQRTINARAIFEQNSSAGQLSSINRNTKVQQEFVSEPKNDISPIKQETVFKHEDTRNSPVKQAFIQHEGSEISTLKKEPVPKLAAALYEDNAPHHDERLFSPGNMRTSVNDSKALSNYQEDESTRQPDLFEDIAEEPDNDSTEVNQILGSTDSNDLWARALYDYQAADETEISFDPDDIITQIEQIDEGWWQGRAPDGTYGLFPANYVELITN